MRETLVLLLVGLSTLSPVLFVPIGFLSQLCPLRESMCQHRSRKCGVSSPRFGHGEVPGSARTQLCWCQALPGPWGTAGAPENNSHPYQHRTSPNLPQRSLHGRAHPSLGSSGCAAASKLAAAGAGSTEATAPELGTHPPHHLAKI